MRTLRQTVLTALLLGLAFGPARSAEGATFRVTPIRVVFDQSASSALLTLTNESTEELRFQISVFQWGQASGTGEMQLTPTTDIMFFPRLLTLGPGKEQKVRVGTNVKPGPAEKTYRIFFEELPSLQKAASGGAQVKIITKMGVPIFISPASSNPAADVTNLTVKDGRLSFQVRNGGNVHFVVLSVRVVGLGSEGNVVFDRQRDGWYVLSGDSRTYDLEVPAGECPRVKSVRIEVQTDLGNKPEDALITREFPVPQGVCK